MQKKNKTLKRILSLLLCCTMLLGMMPVIALAAGTNETQMGTLTITKTDRPPVPVYSLTPTALNEDAEKFTFTVKLTPPEGEELLSSYDAYFNDNAEPVSLKPENGTLTFELGFYDSIKIELPYGTGYAAEETDSGDYLSSWHTSSGYSATPSGIINGNISLLCVNYEPVMGTLAITKTDTVPTPRPEPPVYSLTPGTFTFKVTLTAPEGGKLRSSYPVCINGDYEKLTPVDNTLTFELGFNDNIEIGIPYGTAYTVEEVENEDYYTSWHDADGKSIEPSGVINEYNNYVSLYCVNTAIPMGTLSITKTDSIPSHSVPVYSLKPGTFTFNVTLTAPEGGKLLSSYTAYINGDSVELTPVNNTLTFELGFEDTIEIYLPYGTTYSVEEVETKAYETGWYNYYGTSVEPSGVIDANNTYRSLYCVNILLESEFTVSKIVTGDDADMNKDFNFNVTVDDTTINGVYGEMEFVDGVATFALKHGESLTAKGLPEGIGFEVKEVMAAGDYSHQVTWTVDGEEVATGWDVSATGVIGGYGSKVEVIATNNKLEVGGLIITNVIDEKYEDTIDTEKEFIVTVDFFEGDLDGDGKYTENDRGIAGTINGVFNVTRNDGTKETISVVNGRAQISMKHDETIVIEGLPGGLHYTIKEAKDTEGEYTGMDKNTGDVLTSDNSTYISGTIPNGGYAQEDIVNVRLSNLEISKTVTGEGGDKEFDFEFTLELEDKEINGTYGDVTFTDGVATFTLRHGETKTVEGLPVGIGYTVTEKEYADYEAVYTGRVGTIAEGGSQVSVENKFIEEPTSKVPEPTTKTPEPTTKAPESTKPAPTKSPNTSDNSHPTLWFTLMLASLSGMAVSFAFSKANRKKSQETDE